MIGEDILREYRTREPDYWRSNEVDCAYWNVAHWYDLYDLTAWGDTWHTVLMCLALRAAEEAVRADEMDSAHRWLDRADAHRHHRKPVEA